MGVLAVVVMALFHPPPRFDVFRGGLALGLQVAVGLLFLLIYWVGAAISFARVAATHSAEHIAASYSRLDLTGLNPLWLALAAGIGEELLFRGALQPLIGIHATSALFVLAHLRAYRFDGLNKRVALQCLSLFVLSTGLGLVCHYIGLLAAILIHVAMDVVGLLFVRRKVQAGAAKA